MKQLMKRIRRMAKSRRFGVGLFAAAAAFTAVSLIPSQAATVVPIANLPVQATGPSGVQVVTKLSQSKLVQGSDGTLYLDVSINAPDQEEDRGARKPVDLVVVVDRSGSMASNNKLQLAKSAITELISRLNGEDRFALISFDQHASILSSLAPMLDAERERVQAIVAGLSPGGSTNISGALESARSILDSSASGQRVRKVLLLSDGQANAGVTSSGGLAEIAASFRTRETVLSTIGMGLGFNEVVMASLADHGMGHYAFLEHLGGLSEILHRNLEDARALFAQRSELRLQLAAGTRLIDAGGYPIQYDSQDSARILTGQLLGGSAKHFVITVQIEPHTLGEKHVGELELAVFRSGEPERIPVSSSGLVVAVVPPERRDEVIASIEPGVLRRTWSSNNIGLMQREVQKWVSAGDKAKAMDVFSQFRSALSSAELNAGMPLMEAPAAKKLEEVERSIDDAFSGSPVEQETKRSRLSKEMHAESIKLQRAN